MRRTRAPRPTRPSRIAAAILPAIVLAATDAALAQPEQPFVELLGERFQPTRGGMQGSLGVGFDPVNRQVQSVELTDLCGGSVELFAAGSGCSWDPVNQELWSITQDRVVFREISDEPETLLVIPETFTVPGVGPDTLESSQGLALDDTYLYVVDTGPNPGQVGSNAWFKFERDGTPVSSSKATDFVANLDAAPDAIVDGIAWIPPGSPFGEDLFLIPLEHSGIMVVDENGFFVDELLWQDAGLDVGSDVPFAFAGITIDPLTGDLYLVENAGQLMHVWLREKPQAVDRSRYFSSGGEVQALYPETDCVRPLPNSYGSGVRFAIAYRDVDGLFWSAEYNTAEIFTTDPKDGAWTTVGTVPVTNVWGMAWDDQLDRFYLADGGTGEIWSLDPATLICTLLPQSGTEFFTDLTFDRDSRTIYGISSGTLFAIDPTTGAATDLGPTSGHASIAWDSLTGKLVSASLTAGLLYEYDADSASVATTIATLPTGFAWEALEAVPGTPSATAAPVVAAGAGAPALRLFPNPTRSGTRIAFDRPPAGPVRLGVYDVTGRLVRRLAVGAASAGTGAVDWDGRGASGRLAPPGVYFVRLETSAGTRTGKVSVVR